MKRLYYVHGFLSGPQAVKAQQLQAYLQEHHLEQEISFAAPALPDTPREAWATVVEYFEHEQQAHPQDQLFLVGSSMGGFFSTLISQRLQVPAVLLNPCIHPQEYFAELCGPQVNKYSGHHFELTPDMAPFLADLDATAVANPDLLTVYLGDADEVLDYKKSLDFYRDCPITMIAGADHVFSTTFADFLPQIIALVQKY